MIRQSGQDNTPLSLAASSSSQQAIVHPNEPRLNSEQRTARMMEHESLRTAQTPNHFSNEFTHRPPYLFIPPPRTVMHADTAHHPYAPMNSAQLNVSILQALTHTLFYNTGQSNEVYTQQGVGLLSAALSINFDDPNWITGCLRELNHHYIEGRILNISNTKQRGLGCFRLPNPSQFPIKFDFPVSQEHLTLFTSSEPKSFTIGGNLMLNMKHVSDYVHNHPPGSFRRLWTQDKPAYSIPITLDQIILMDRNGRIVSSPEVQKVVSHLKSLQGKTVTAKVLYFQPGHRGGIACHEENGLKTRFLFRLPPEYRNTPIEQIKSQFDRLSATIDISMNQNELINYVIERRPAAFESDGDGHKIYIFSKNTRLIQKDTRQD